MAFTSWRGTGSAKNTSDRQTRRGGFFIRFVHVSRSLRSHIGAFWRPPPPKLSGWSPHRHSGARCCRLQVDMRYCGTRVANESRRGRNGVTDSGGLHVSGRNRAADTRNDQENAPRATVRGKEHRFGACLSLPERCTAVRNAAVRDAACGDRARTTRGAGARRP